MDDFLQSTPTSFNVHVGSTHIIFCTFLHYHSWLWALVISTSVGTRANSWLSNIIDAVFASSMFCTSFLGCLCRPGPSLLHPSFRRTPAICRALNYERRVGAPSRTRTSVVGVSIAKDVRCSTSSLDPIATLGDTCELHNQIFFNIYGAPSPNIQRPGVLSVSCRICGVHYTGTSNSRLSALAAFFWACVKIQPSWPSGVYGSTVYCLVDLGSSKTSGIICLLFVSSTASRFSLLSSKIEKSFLTSRIFKESVILASPRAKRL